MEQDDIIKSWSLRKHLNTMERSEIKTNQEQLMAEAMLGQHQPMVEGNFISTSSNSSNHNFLHDSGDYLSSSDCPPITSRSGH